MKMTRKLLTLIMPVFNNRQGVISSLLSFGNVPANSNWDINVLIVNDCSTVDDYTDIPNLLGPFFSKITILKTPKNVGPGLARQYGLDQCSSPYFMFLDAGDLITSPVTLLSYLSVIEDNPNILLFCAAHEELFEDFSSEYVGPEHNRVHGKVYKTDFVKRHNIRFTENAVSYNEDIGFNLACRLVADHIAEKTGIFTAYAFEPVVVSWTCDLNSITRRDNCAFDILQNQGTGPHIIHAFEIAYENGVPADVIIRRGYESFMYQYMWHYEGLMQKRLIAESFEGCLYFYKHFFKKLSKIDEEFFTSTYCAVMRELFASPHPVALTTTIPTYTIIDFLNELEQASQE